MGPGGGWFAAQEEEKVKRACRAQPTCLRSLGKKACPDPAHGLLAVGVFIPEQQTSEISKTSEVYMESSACYFLAERNG
jgi:hypothetical protein